MDRPVDSCWPPPMTIFGQVLDPPTEGQERIPTAVGIPWQNRSPRLQGRHSPFTSIQPSTHSPGTPSIPVVLPTRTLAVRQSTTLTRGFIDTAVNTELSEPTRPDGRTSADVSAVGRMASKVSSINAGRIILDNSTRAMYLDIIAASMGQMVIGSTEPKEGPTIEDLMDQL